MCLRPEESRPRNFFEINDDIVLEIDAVNAYRYRKLTRGCMKCSQHGFTNNDAHIHSLVWFPVLGAVHRFRLSILFLDCRTSFAWLGSLLGHAYVWLHGQFSLSRSLPVILVLHGHTATCECAVNRKYTFPENQN